MSKEIMKFDKENLQEDFKYIAKDISTGEYKIGYVVVEKPWYSPKRDWTYYIVENKYGSSGICGGAVNLGFEQTIIDPDTIEPYTQTAHIKYNQSIGIDNVLVKNFMADIYNKDNIREFIGVNDRIPLELWK